MPACFRAARSLFAARPASHAPRLPLALRDRKFPSGALLSHEAAGRFRRSRRQQRPPAQSPWLELRAWSRIRAIRGRFPALVVSLLLPSEPCFLFDFQLADRFSI